MSIFRRNHPVQDRIRFDVGGGGGGGGGAGDGTAAEPTDAIHALRKRLGEAFLRLEPDWHSWTRHSPRCASATRGGPTKARPCTNGV
jgi:hypothetical protein